MKHSPFDAMISALGSETSALGAETSVLAAETSALGADTSALGAETLVLGAETSALGAAISALTRSFRQYRCRVSGNIGAEFPAISVRSFRRLRIGITTQMCNRVTNHGNMGTFSKPIGKCSFYFNCYFFIQLQQTQTSDRKLCIVRSGSKRTKIVIYQ